MLLDPNRLRYSVYFDYYENHLDELFRVPQDMINGLALVGNQVQKTEFNYFNAVSRFYSNAVLAELPELDAELVRLIGQLTEHWSIAGEAFLVGRPGDYRAVRPDYVFPISDEFDRDKINKYFFIYPRRETELHQFRNFNIGAKDALVIEYDVETGDAYQSIRKYGGQRIADEPRGEKVDIGTVAWMRCSGSIYPNIETLVREVIVRLNVLQLALNSTSMPIVEIDKGNIANGILQNEVSNEEIQGLISRPLGLTLPPPFEGEQSASYIERSGNGLTESLEYVRLVLGQLGVISGVPDYVFGINLGRPRDETERVLFAGQARVNSFKKELQEALRQFNIALTFNAEAFISRRERVDLVINQFTNGIITLAEARDYLGLDSTTEVPQTGGEE